MQRCARCKENKPVADFAWRRKARGQLDTYCRPCRAAYKQKHYAANRQTYIDRAAARTRRLAKERAEFLIDYFLTHPCVDCGEADPIVLEFDHQQDKAFGIANGLRSRSWDALIAEMAKCEVVCANCHRRRTAERGGFVRAAVAQRQSLALPRR